MCNVVFNKLNIVREMAFSYCAGMSALVLCARQTFRWTVAIGQNTIYALNGRVREDRFMGCCSHWDHGLCPFEGKDLFIFFFIFGRYTWDRQQIMLV